MALLSKPSAVMVPMLLGVIDRFMLGRPSRRVARSLLPLLVMAGAIAVVGRLVQPPLKVALIGWAWRPLVAMDSLAFYARKLVMPWDLAVAYGRHPAAARMSGQLLWTWIVPAAGALAAWKWRRGRPWLPAAALIFALAPAPVLGLLPFDYQRISTVADHYVYLALLGPALLIAGVVASTARTGSSRAADCVRRCCCALVAAMLVFLAYDARIQLRYWRTNLEVWEHAVAVAPRCAEAHENLAFAFGDLGGAGDVEREAREFAIAVQLKPEDLRDRDLYAGALMAAGHVNEAIDQMLAVMRLQEQRDAKGAIRPDEDRLTAYRSLGELLLAKRRSAEAAALFRKVLGQVPGDRKARHGLTLCALELPSRERDGAGAPNGTR
jgi:hypothetical protein